MNRLLFKMTPWQPLEGQGLKGFKIRKGKKKKRKETKLKTGKNIL